MYVGCGLAVPPLIFDDSPGISPHGTLVNHRIYADRMTGFEAEAVC